MSVIYIIAWLGLRICFFLAKTKTLSRLEVGLDRHVFFCHDCAFVETCNKASTLRRKLLLLFRSIRGKKLNTLKFFPRVESDHFCRRNSRRCCQCGRGLLYACFIVFQRCYWRWMMQRRRATLESVHLNAVTMTTTTSSFSSS